MQSRFIFIWVTALSLGVASGASETQFCVEGTSTVTTFDRNRRAGVSTVSDFKFYRDGCSWFRESRTRTGKGGTAFGNRESRTEAGCDGTNIYMLTPSGGSLSSNRFEQSARIQAGPVPLFGSHGALCWLTYASGCVLRGREERFRPVYDGYHAGAPVRITLAVQPDSPGFVRRIEFFQTYRGTRQEFTNAIFEVTEFTNHAGHVIPRRASLFVYRLFQDVPYLSERQELTMSKLGNETRSSFIPDMGDRLTLTTDARFNQRDDDTNRSGVNYGTQVWLSENQVKGMSVFKQYTNLVERRRLANVTFGQRTRFRSHLFLLVMLCLFIAPAVAVMWRRMRKTSGTNQKE